MNSILLCSQKKVSKMDDLDSLFEGELASINQVFQEFEVKDKKMEQRIQTEEEELERVQSKVSQGGGRGKKREKDVHAGVTLLLNFLVIISRMWNLTF